jgi:tripartite-type tricarboxylate transporter receptor subunit TctC
MQVTALRRLPSGLSVGPSAMSKRTAPEGRVPLLAWIMTAFAVMAAAPPSAFAQSPFFQGKTVKVIVAGTPGGTADFRVRALVPFLHKHVPGNPTVVLEFMDGSGGRKAANYMYANARPDGLTIGALSGGMVALQLMGEAGVIYDVDKFVYLGSTEGGSHQIIYTRKELGLDSIEKLRAASGIRIGAQSVGHVAYVSGRLFAYLIGMKGPKFIAGYSAPEVDAALFTFTVLP